MSIDTWVISNLVNLIFWIWILFFGGAEWLEGSFLSGLLLAHSSPKWNAEVIRFFGWISLIISTLAFIVGLVRPDLRWLSW